jgi:hypothetical protein
MYAILSATPLDRAMPAKKKTAAAKKPAPSTKPLWQKLFIKGGTVLLVNAPAGYDKLLAGSPAKVVTRASGTADTVLVFATDESQLKAALPLAAKSLAPTSNLWVAYRKGDKQLHRDTLWQLGEKFGFTGVSLVAVDDTWSAMRFKTS